MSSFSTKTSVSAGPEGEEQIVEHGARVLQNFREQIKKGADVVLDHSTLASIVDAVTNNNSIDDRKMLLEHALSFLSRLPAGGLSTKLQNAIVKLLYNDLPHPAATYIGNQYAWRTADGSHNNVSVPDMGKAGTPYARSVQQSHPIPKNSLPDPGLVFDTLLKRDKFEKHPAGLSSMMFSFAALVIHSVFRTSHYDVNINETSSYVDLSPLYGHNQQAQDRVRVRDGRGLLYPDVFAEDRLLLLPPAVCVILVLFSRNHNFIAKKLFEINERGTYQDPATLPAGGQLFLAQEEEIFQLARLCNSAWFASVVFSDYFSCILGLVRQGSSWSLNPFGEIRNQDHSMFERGQGNVCSVEFNCLYRWHATTSAEDEEWIQQIFGQLFEGKSPEMITPMDFAGAAKKMQDSEPDIQHWTFGRLQRQADGTFKDEDLANVLKNASEHPAAAFRARGTPPIMRLHETMGIEQNRRWGVCSLNDFRKFLGLKPYASFREWNPRPEIADAAEKLYGHIDHLELYVGLQAEEAKPVVDGAGLCPGYTISRAILSDAIALTRGDRFFTSDYTPFNMTAWGFADCQRDSTGAGFGSTLGRLFLRTLPEQYTSNSVYTWFPLMTPDSMKIHLTKLNLLGRYDLKRPGVQASYRTVKDHAEIADILKNTAGFKTPYAERAASVIKGKGFFLASADVAAGEKEQREVVAALLALPDAVDKIGTFFYSKTRELILSNSFAGVGGKTHSVDIVRDVIKFIPLYWAASEIAGIQLKTKKTPIGVYTPSELYDILGEIYSYLFLEVEPSKRMVLGEKVKKNIKELLRHIKDHLFFGNQRLSVSGFIGTISQLFGKYKKQERNEFVKRLSDAGHSSDELANYILAIMVGSTVELSLALTNILDLFLGSDQEIQIRGSDLKSLDAYVFEALRLAPSFQGVFRISSQGERVFLDIGQANQNAQLFSNPTAIDLNRSTKDCLDGDGIVRRLGKELTAKIIGETLRAVFAFENFRRAPGQSGTLTRFRDDSQAILCYSYLDQNQFATPWPTSLVVQYDTATVGNGA
jgi:hypothetical protein